MLIDNHNRPINYLRLAVTDRCNLRCNYCMPAEGISFAERNELLTITEMKRLSEILVAQGVDKIRITGGEPFARKNLMDLLRFLSNLQGLKDISITTNATLIAPYIDELFDLGIRNINVSLDALDEASFFKITRRDEFQIVENNLFKLIEKGFKVRINCVVLENQNDKQIIPLVKFTKANNICVRFLEEMPFNGGTKTFASIKWDYKAILSHIQAEFPEIEALPSEKTTTSTLYKIPKWKGSFGLIPSFSRTFCGTCNRLRISAKGDIITCLYANAYANLRAILRSDFSNEKIEQLILKAVANRAKNGHEAEKKANKVFDSSMTSIGG